MLTKTELQAQISALSRMIYGPPQNELTPEQMKHGYIGPIMDVSQFTQIKMEISKLESLLPFAPMNAPVKS
jgi:hypothetical protein